MKVLNDSRWIAAIVYVGVPIVIVFFVMTFVLSPWLHLSGAIYCIGLFVASSIFLGFIFIPKVSLDVFCLSSVHCAHNLQAGTFNCLASCSSL